MHDLPTLDHVLGGDATAVCSGGIGAGTNEQSRHVHVVGVPEKGADHREQVAAARRLAIDTHARALSLSCARARVCVCV